METLRAASSLPLYDARSTVSSSFSSSPRSVRPRMQTSCQVSRCAARRAAAGCAAAVGGEWKTISNADWKQGMTLASAPISLSIGSRQACWQIGRGFRSAQSTSSRRLNLTRSGDGSSSGTFSARSQTRGVSGKDARPGGMDTAFGRGMGLGLGLGLGRTRDHRRGGAIRAVTLPSVTFPSTPLIAAGDTWGTWTVLLGLAAFGIWSEKTTWGSALSGALVSTLGGLVASNCGLIAASAPAYSTVNTYLLPLAVPLLLYGSDLRRVIGNTGRLLLAFCIGSVTTTIGTVVAWLVVPLRSLGSDGWKIAAALMSRHIGGAVNYVAVSEALGTSSSMLAAGLAADNLICAVYFTTLFALAANIPAEPTNSDENESSQGFGASGLKMEEGAISLALSAAICAMGTAMAKSLNINGGGIPCITLIVVMLATLFPSWLGALGPTAEGLAIILLQIFFATVGANASISAVVTKAPSLFIYSFVQVAVHLGLILGAGKLFGFQRREILLASNANVGGPSTAAGMATAKGWRSLNVPAILCGIFGIAIATFVSIVFGVAVLSKM